MDYYLPDMAGAELLKRLRQRRAQLRVLVLSASQDPDDERRAMEAGARGFLNKSASCQALTAALEAINAADAPRTPLAADLRWPAQQGNIRTAEHDGEDRQDACVGHPGHAGRA
ncbi:hypothetical protein G6F45_013891 [Rhizopus arrhizus]|nr:hypothetical protein G6F45_013891 [Rhizopus arrhizus]